MNSEKVALIFGGARGIGAAIAARLAKEGYRVAVTWVSRPDRANALVSSITDAGGRWRLTLIAQMQLQFRLRLMPRSTITAGWMLP